MVDPIIPCIEDDEQDPLEADAMEPSPPINQSEPEEEEGDDDSIEAATDDESIDLFVDLATMDLDMDGNACRDLLEDEN